MMVMMHCDNTMILAVGADGYGSSKALILSDYGPENLWSQSHTEWCIMAQKASKARAILGTLSQWLQRAPAPLYWCSVGCTLHWMAANGEELKYIFVVENVHTIVHQNKSTPTFFFYIKLVNTLILQNNPNFILSNLFMLYCIKLLHSVLYRTGQNAWHHNSKHTLLLHINIKYSAYNQCIINLV